MSDDSVADLPGLPAIGRRAIAFADLAESVRLYLQQEAATIRRWRRFAEAARAAVAAIPRARVVRTAGDGLLMELASPADAVAAAARLHALMQDGNHEAAPAEPMWLRIGIHVAEVVAEEHELYGAGVNLAARLASLAQPGGTVLSVEAREALAEGVHAEFEDLGLRYLKHIDEPVRAFVARRPGSGATMPVPAEDLRPTLAVVPFIAWPAGPENEALGFAMADEIIASLARHPGLRVLSRTSTMAVRDAALDLARLRELLGASFLLSGRCHVQGDQVRLAAELCELRRGEVLWTGSARADVGALFMGQDDLVPQLVAQVAQQVIAHELTRVRSLPMDTLASYTLYLGASGLMNSLVRRDFGRAGEVLQHLRERHPRQAAPAALLARWHVFKAVQGWAEDRAREAGTARSLALSAIDVDPAQAVAHSALALVKLNFDGDVDGAEQSNQRAIGADPMDPHAWAQLAGAQVFLGRHAAACESALRALQLSPLDPCRYLFEAYAAMAHLAAGLFADAAGLAARSVQHHALHAPSHRILIGARWLGGDTDGARQAAQRYLQAYPDARVGGDHLRPVAGHETWRLGFAQALREAGVPA